MNPLDISSETDNTSQNSSQDLTEIQRYYAAAPEQEHQRLERHQLEFDLTWKYLEEHLPPCGRILEVGAATGRYTVPLAEKGHALTALDLSPDLLELNRQHLEAAALLEQVQLAQADARDLSAFHSQDYDAVLLMGPLYHLRQESDRIKAIREGLACLKVGGLFVSAWISRLGIFADLIQKMPDWIEQSAEVEHYLQTGCDLEVKPGGFMGYFATSAEIPLLHEAQGIKTLALAACEPFIGGDDSGYNQLPQPQRQLWLELFYRLSGQAEVYSTSRHLLYLGQKL